MKVRNLSKLGTAMVVLTAAVALSSGIGSVRAADGDAQKDDGAMHRAVKNAQVRLALLENVGVDAMRINIDVEGEDVTLSGTVHERTTAELAKTVVESVDGVNDVDVDLEVAEMADDTMRGEAAAELSDAVLAAKVKIALLSELGTSAFNIDVESADGVVALSGHVDGDERKTMAATATKGVSGVKEVRNLLKASKS